MGETGKGGKVGQSGGESKVFDLATSLINESGPVRQELLAQTAEALKTGGVGARLPIAQRAIEGSRAATSQALMGLDENLARSGLNKSSYGINARANTLLSGEQQTQGIPQAVAEQFIATAPTLSLGFGGQAMQGFSSAGGLANQRAGISAQRDIAKGQQQTEYVKALTSMVGMAAMGCWVAAALFGEGSPKHLAARRFIFDVWRGPLAEATRRAYMRHGRWIARRRWARLAVWPAFEVAAWLGRRT